MLKFDPADLVSEMQRISAQRFNPEAHHIIAVLQVLQDNQFSVRGIASNYIEKLQGEGLNSFKELTFSHEAFPNVWFIWNVEPGDIEVVEGEHPEISEELVDLDINDFLGFGVDGELIEVIGEILGDSEVRESLSWAECVDKLQEFEIYSDDEDLEMMQAFVQAMENKIINKG